MPETRGRVSTPFLPGGSTLDTEKTKTSHSSSNKHRQAPVICQHCSLTLGHCVERTDPMSDFMVLMFRGSELMNAYRMSPVPDCQLACDWQMLQGISCHSRPLPSLCPKGPSGHMSSGITRGPPPGYPFLRSFLILPCSNTPVICLHLPLFPSRILHGAFALSLCPQGTSLPAQVSSQHAPHFLSLTRA